MSLAYFFRYTKCTFGHSFLSVLPQVKWSEWTSPEPQRYYFTCCTHNNHEIRCNFGAALPSPSPSLMIFALAYSLSLSLSLSSSSFPLFLSFFPPPSIQNFLLFGRRANANAADIALGRKTKTTPGHPFNFGDAPHDSPSRPRVSVLSFGSHNGSITSRFPF